jgi:FAD/FMN-containing dehydrogenase
MARCGNSSGMRRVIRRHIRHRSEGLDLAVDVNAVIAINRGDTEQDAGQGRDDAAGTVRRTTVATSHVEPDREDTSTKEDR